MRAIRPLGTAARGIRRPRPHRSRRPPRPPAVHRKCRRSRLTAGESSAAVAGRPAACSSARRASAPAPAPTRTGMTSRTVAFGLVIAASTPTPARTASPIHPERGRRSAAFPMAIAAAAMTRPIPSSRTCLSLAPNERIAKDLSQVGELSIAASPTVITGDAAASTHPAARCATPRVTPAVTSPITGPSHLGGAAPRVVVHVHTYGWSPLGAQTLHVIVRRSRSDRGRSRSRPRRSPPAG